MKIIAVTNQKGGVGKTTIAFNLMRALADKGFKVLAIDNDPQGNLTDSFLENGVDLTADIMDLYSGKTVYPQKIDNNLDLIGANIHLAKIADQDFEVIFRLKEGLEQIQKPYDYIIIDCLPSFGYLNTAALNAAESVVIPTKPSQFGLAGVTDLLDTIEKTKKRLNPKLNVLGIVLNLVEHTVICHEFTKVLRETYGDLIFETDISKSVKMEECVTLNQSVTTYDPKSKSAKQLQAFVDEFLKREEVK